MVFVADHEDTAHEGGAVMAFQGEVLSVSEPMRRSDVQRVTPRPSSTPLASSVRAKSANSSTAPTRIGRLPQHQYLLDEVAARAAVQREEDAEQVGTRAPSAADMVQQYAADVCQTTGRDRVAPDDAEHMVVELQAARAARPDVSEHDRQVAQALLDDLQNAMGD